MQSLDGCTLPFVEKNSFDTRARGCVISRAGGRIVLSTRGCVVLRARGCAISRARGGVVLCARGCVILRVAR